MSTPNESSAQVEESVSPKGVVYPTEELVPFGGFSFVELLAEGAGNLNPARKARREIFLSDEDRKEDRSVLKKNIETLIEILSGSDNLDEMLAKCEEKVQALRKNIDTNISKVIGESKELEQAYRSVCLFFGNTLKEEVKNITFINTSMEQITDLDTALVINYVNEEFKQNFDRLDLRNNYSLLVIPGYLGSNKVVEKWANVAYTNKVLMVTDFMHLDRPDDVIDMFYNANLTSADSFKSNVCMTCNWLVGRTKFEQYGEEEDLFVPPSSALAGRFYNSLLSQVIAGKKYGSLFDTDAVAFELRKSDLSTLEQMGLIPMVNEYGKVMAFSGKTLFNGDNMGLQTYSVVRVFDYITKVLCDFLNRRAFENWDLSLERDLRGQITKFLGNIQGSGKLIESFGIVRLQQDQQDKDRIYMDVHVTPFFPSKSFVLRLDGYKGEDLATTWASMYEQVVVA